MHTGPVPEKLAGPVLLQVHRCKGLIGDYAPLAAGAALHPMVPVVLLSVASQAVQQVEELGRLHEGLVHSHVGLPI